MILSIDQHRRVADCPSGVSLARPPLEKGGSRYELKGHSARYVPSRVLLVCVCAEIDIASRSDVTVKSNMREDV